MEGGWRDSRGEDDRQEGHEDLGAGGCAPCLLILPDSTPTQSQRPGFPQLHELRPHTANRPVTHLLYPLHLCCVSAGKRFRSWKDACAFLEAGAAKDAKQANGESLRLSAVSPAP